MRFVGVHLGPHAGVCIIDEDGRVDFFGHCERYSRTKYYAFGLKPLQRAFPKLEKLKSTDVVAVVTYRSEDDRWQNIENVATHDTEYNSMLVRHYVPKRRRNNLWTENIGRNPDFSVSQHMASVFATWCYRENDDERRFVAYDNYGFDASGYLRSSLVGSISKSHFNMYPQLKQPIPSTKVLNGLLGFDSFNKAMGMASYCQKRLNSEQLLDHMIEHSFHAPNYQARYPFVPRNELTKENMSFVASFYEKHMNKIWQAVRHHMGKSCLITGTGTLAADVNTKVVTQCEDLLYGPAADESGLALGAACFAYFDYNGEWPRLENASLCSLQRPLPSVGPQKPSEIAKLLANGKIVGLIRGRAEIGPRGLGNRVILASAKNRKVKRRLNHLTGCMFYEQLPCVVTPNQFDDLFDGPRGRFGQYLVKGKGFVTAAINGEHAQPQVTDDPWMIELLQEYGKLSGVECLLSLPLQKEHYPICNTYQDAAKDFKDKDITLISLPHDSWSPNIFLA